jgi:hypothetical protein
VTTDDHRVVFAQGRQIPKHGSIEFLSSESVLEFGLHLADRLALFFARSKTREFLFARFGATSTRPAITAKGLSLTRLTITTKRLTLTRFSIAAKGLSLTRFSIAAKGLSLTRFPITAKWLTLTVARGAFAARAIASAFRRAKTARTRFAR